MTLTLETEFPARWVSAPPFRAHVRHVAACSGVPWPVLAMLAGVSLSMADHLLHGRHGRPVRRISRECAVRLLAVTPEVVGAAHQEWVPADRAVRLVRWLVGQGWSLPDLSAASGVDLPALTALTNSDQAFVLASAELRLRALLAELDRGAARRGAA